MGFSGVRQVDQANAPGDGLKHPNREQCGEAGAEEKEGARLHGLHILGTLETLAISPLSPIASCIRRTALHAARKVLLCITWAVCYCRKLSNWWGGRHMKGSRLFTNFNLQQ